MIVASLATACLTLLCIVPAPAMARGPNVVPPGNSGVNQYLEVVPTAKGGRPGNTIHPVTSQSGGSGSSSALSPRARRAFARAGRAGRSAAALAEATAPAAHSRKSARVGAGSSVSGPSGPTGSGASPNRGAAPLSTLANALTGSSTPGGLGWLLPAILILVVVGGGMIVTLRHRHST